DDAFEFPVFDWMIFDMHCEPLVIGIEARSFGYCPAQQHTVQLQPKIIVKTAGGVLLYNKSERVFFNLRLPPFWLRRDTEVAFLTIGFQRHDLTLLRGV